MATVSVDPLQQAAEGYLEQSERSRLENIQWRPSLRHEDPRDRFDRKLYQAEMLAHTLTGEGWETFTGWHDRIQEGVLWLLADTITEAREAMSEADQAHRKPKA